MLPGLTAVGIAADGVYLVRAVREPEQRPRIEQWEFRPVSPDAPQDKVLAGLARDHDLKHARCTTLLGEAEYQLVLTEAPDVHADELKAALRWRVKDLINFHINDASLDVFDLPGDVAPGRAREMYVVAARNDAIRARADALEAAGINLDVIDIPELAQRNVSSLLPEDANGVAMLTLQAASGLITLTRQGLLYLSRTLGVGFDTLQAAAEPAGYHDHIVLEIQRSLDYYESHFREAPIRHLVLGGAATGLPMLIEHLRANLNVQVSVLDLAPLLDCNQSLPQEMQARCLVHVGAALRQEVRAL
ncbi:MAG: pilus assembly protein PilM [Gammaproteobacteria bacterium]|nr:pilus assembly protein PilM [Gammaproteobacteria bacterium]